MRTLIAALLVFTLIPAGFAKDNNPNPYPRVWGVVTHNSSCVIFKETLNPKRHFWGFEIYGVLEVIETQNYTLEQKKWIENQANMNELQRLAMRDMVKFVKIPNNHIDQLEKARNVCKESVDEVSPTTNEATRAIRRQE